MSDGDLSKLNIASQVVAAGRPKKRPDGELNPPIALNSTYHAGGEIGYGRYGNETWSAIETAISLLENGNHSILFSSGLAAIAAVFEILPEGAVVTSPHDGYQGTMELLRQHHKSGRLQVNFLDFTDIDSVISSLSKTQMLYLESPTNPALEVIDLPKLISAAKNAGCGVVVDNTFATPINQQPLNLGADIVMHSVTKYLAGHSDVLLGSLSTNDAPLHRRLLERRKYGGAIPGPVEAWIALRGIRTFVLRMERAQSNAMELAKRLSKHPKVSRVRYPGLPTDPFHNMAKSFMKGFGAVISFEVDGTNEKIDQVCAASKLITYSTSLGGVESLWERRRRWSTESTSIPENLVRFSVGIENVDDLWADIEQALKKAN